MGLREPQKIVFEDNQIVFQGSQKTVRSIGLVVLEGASALDFMAIVESFLSADEVLGRESGAAESGMHYRIVLLETERSRRSEQFRFALKSAKPLGSSANVAFDTIVIAGGLRQPAADERSEVVTWVRTMRCTVRRFAAAGWGNEILVGAGLLRRDDQVLHWLARGASGQAAPRLYRKVGNIYACPGKFSGIDMTLAMLEDDHGHRLSLDVARELVVFRRRLGHEPQQSVEMQAQAAPTNRIQICVDFIMNHLSEPLTVRDLARVSSMSERTFARRFAKETAKTPNSFVQEIRLATACRKLVSTRWSIKRIARYVGLGSGDALRRLFVRKLGKTPTDYRSKASQIDNDE